MGQGLCLCVCEILSGPEKELVSGIVSVGQVGNAFRFGVHTCRTPRTHIWDGRRSLSCPQSYTSASLHSFARDQRTGWALGVLRVVWRWLLEFSNDHGSVCPDRSPFEEGLAKPPAGGLQPSLSLRVYFSLGQGHTLPCPIEAGAESWPRQRPLWDSLCHRNLPSSLRGGPRLCPASITISLLLVLFFHGCRPLTPC